jgi:hypothetical protein
MRKTVALAFLTGVLVLLLAGTAAAKDPFEPLVTTDTSTAAPGTTGTTGEEPAVIGVNPNTDSNADSISDSMPSTGSDTSPWFVLAYGLLVAGGAALALSHTLRPARL